MGQIKNIKLHIVTDIKVGEKKLQKSTAGESLRHQEVNWYTSIQRRLVQHPNVVTVRRSYVASNPFVRRFLRHFLVRRRRFHVRTEVRGVPNVFVKESCEL